MVEGVKTYMRIKNSLYNMIGVVALYFIKIFLSFMGKTCLIRIMGNEYNGINALFNSIISMLSIAELGIGSAIIYNLYKPVKENNIREIKSIMHLYKVCYRAIATIVLAIGICITPFVKLLVGNVSITDNIYVLFYLFLADAVASYLLTYKRSIFYANQKNYIVSICDIGYTFLMQILQIVVLIVAHSYIGYITIGIVCRIIENLVIQYFADKKYPYLKEKNIPKLSRAVSKNIIENVKGLLFHKIGGYIVYGTDNIIISRMVNIVAEGFYSNYLTIINPLSNILAQIISALQASVGNLLVDKNKEKDYEIYKRIDFLNSWLSTVCCVCIFCLIQDFIVVWLGDNYLFSRYVVFVLSINFWQTGMRNVLGVFKNAAGIFYTDRYVPIIESVVNLTVSILLTKFYGIIGVFLGTFVSSLVVFLYSFPILVYIPLFGKKYADYIMEMMSHIIDLSACLIISWFCVQVIETGGFNGYFKFIIKALSVFGISNIVLFVLKHKNPNLNYYIVLIRNYILKGKK